MKFTRKEKLSRIIQIFTPTIVLLLVGNAEGVKDTLYQFSLSLNRFLGTDYSEFGDFQKFFHHQITQQIIVYLPMVLLAFRSARQMIRNDESKRFIERNPITGKFTPTEKLEKKFERTVLKEIARNVKIAHSRKREISLAEIRCIVRTLVRDDVDAMLLLDQSSKYTTIEDFGIYMKPKVIKMADKGDGND